MTWLQTNILPKENVWLKLGFSSYFSDIYFSSSVAHLTYGIIKADSLWGKSVHVSGI